MIKKPSVKTKKKIVNILSQVALVQRLGIDNELFQKKRDHIEKVLQAVRELPPTQKEIIERRYFSQDSEDLHDYDVYEAMNMNNQQFTSLRYIALKQIAVSLGIDVQEEWSPSTVSRKEKTKVRREDGNKDLRKKVMSILLSAQIARNEDFPHEGNKDIDEAVESLPEIERNVIKAQYYSLEYKTNEEVYCSLGIPGYLYRELRNLGLDKLAVKLNFAKQ